MAQLTEQQAQALGAGDDETAWEGFTDDTAIIQRRCPDCDKGLIYTPVRFCPRCGGWGYLNRTVASASATGEAL